MIGDAALPQEKKNNLCLVFLQLLLVPDLQKSVFESDPGDRVLGSEHKRAREDIKNTRCSIPRSKCRATSRSEVSDFWVFATAAFDSRLYQATEFYQPIALKIRSSLKMTLSLEKSQLRLSDTASIQHLQKLRKLEKVGKVPKKQGAFPPRSDFPKVGIRKQRISRDFPKVILCVPVFIVIRMRE